MLKIARKFSSYTGAFALTDPKSLKIPTFRVIDEEGSPISQDIASSPEFNKELLTKIYKTMMEVQEFDTLYYDLHQRCSNPSDVLATDKKNSYQWVVSPGHVPNEFLSSILYYG